MKYQQAISNDIINIHTLVQETIHTVYPKYYPEEIVDFFSELHTLDKIKQDVDNHAVMIFYDKEKLVGTGSYHKNHITRVFVSPQCQNKGYGTYIMKQLEAQIFKQYNEVYLDASLPAVLFYERRGYGTVRHETCGCRNGVVLVYGVMRKRIHNFSFRSIFPEEAAQAAAIEQICFPPNEACSEKMMKERIAVAPDLFLVAIDQETGKIAGFLNGLSTKECIFRDEFFTDATLYDPEGENIMLLGLDVLPEYRGQGLAKEIVFQYCRREREKGRKQLLLTCLESKVKMYEKMGFHNHGIANSSWGGEQWYEMGYTLNY